MDLAATQIYEDEDFPLTQEISRTNKKGESMQVGTLSIDSTDYQIKEGITKIGRLNNCDIIINHMTVSKIHAEIEASGDRRSTWICDLNSSNHTKLNDLILRPNRSYELNDGSVIAFGQVIATYRRYHPADDIVIPETPAPPRQRVGGTIIPNTPDSSLNSSNVDDDGSVILGTQKENDVFLQPLVPKQHRSINKIDKQNTSRVSSMSESDDSQITNVLHESDIDITKNREDNIFDVETQKLEKEHKKVQSSSIHDIETQTFSANASEHPAEANTETNKQLSQLSIRNKITNRFATDIYNMETQNYTDDINEMETQNSEDNVQNITIRKFRMDIHNVETQNYIGDNKKNKIQKPKIDKSISREEDLDPVDRNIHDLETQKLGNKCIAGDISDLETQLELDGVTNTTKDISDVETQFEMDSMANETNNDRAVKDKDDTADITKDGTNYENPKSPKSRSTTPGSLNLSSPGVDEDCLSLASNQSSHLLESSALLHYFGEDIDKQENVRASNTSTPKPKTSSKKDDIRNVLNTSDNEEDNDEDIFNAPTQRISRKFEDLMSDDSESGKKNAIIKVSEKKRGKSQLKQTDDDSETDAEEYLEELAKQQRESLGTSDKSCNENVANKNDPGTSVESEDMFDALTQLNNHTAKDALNRSINRTSKINKTDTIIDDMAPTQIINDIGNARDPDNQANTSSIDINNMATQVILCETSKTMINSENSLSKNNQNDIDDAAPTQVINANLDQNLDRSKSPDCSTPEDLDRENIDYEMAPTQVIGEIENEENRNFSREKTSSAKLNDTLEEKLNEMFDEVNNESIHEPPQISTQYLEDILESSQCDNDSPANKSILGNRNTDNVSKKQSGKNKRATCDQSSGNLPVTEIDTNNVNKVEIVSHNSDIYFSTITTKQKRNILRDTQELIIPVVDVLLSRRDINSSRLSEAKDEKTEDDNIATRSKKTKRIPKSKIKSDAMTDNLNDDNANKAISGKKKNKDLRSLKSTEQKDGVAPEMSKQVSERYPSKVKVDDAGENLTSDSNICAPCPLDNGQRTQTLNTVYESDDDILTRLPAVRISGTLSNPGSPASSTSTVRSARSKRAVARDKDKKNVLSRDKSHEREWNSEKDEKLNQTDDSGFEALKIDKTSDVSSVDTSEDSDSGTNYKRFKQIAARMLNNDLNYPKRQDKRNVEDNKIAISNGKESSLLNVSKDSKQNTDVEAKNLLPASSRVTRHSSRQNDKSSRVLQKEAQTEDNDRSINSQTMSTVAKRKRSLSMTKEYVEQSTSSSNSKKHKAAQVIEEHPVLTRGRRNTMKTVTDRQSPNNLDNVTKTTSRGHSPVIGNIKSSKNKKTGSKTMLEETPNASLQLKKNKNVDSGKSHVNDVTADEDSSKNKKDQEERETKVIQMQDGKILKILLKPIKSPVRSPVRTQESQEVEMIMGRASCNVDNENLLIREGSNVKIFQRESRTKRKKRVNADTETALTESSVSSDIDDSDNTQFDSPTSKVKRGRFAKNSVPKEETVPGVQMPGKKKTFVKPTRTNQNSARSILESSTENSIRDSQNSTESDTSSSSRISRSKAASIKKMIEMNQDTHRMVDNNTSRINASVEITSFASTPSRTRRSISVLSNSSPSAAKHKVLFTGITEDYGKVLKTLGGSKVEDPAKCTVLVTDKVRRTYKFLCALAKGLPIVAIDWLRDSESAAQFLDWQSYILKDPAAEAKFGFRLRKSLDKAKEKRLLDGYTIILTSNVAPPPIEELKNMITSCGGKALLRPPVRWPEKAVIVSREEDLQNAKKFLAKAPKTVTIQSTEFILTGILRQEIDFDKYKLT